MLGAAALLPLGARAHARPLAAVTGDRVLRIAVYEDHRPFCWRDQAELRGIDVDLGRAVAAALGVAPEFVVRYAGEDVETDLRANVWRGPLTGGGVADVMLHVPADRDYTRRLEHVMVANPYYRHQLAFAVDARTEFTPGYDLVNEAVFAVQSKSMSDYFLGSSFRTGAVENLRHFVRIEDAVEAFRAGEVQAVAGTRAELEGLLFPRPEGVRIYSPPIPPPFRGVWMVGMAVKEDSRDLNYAIGEALARLRAEGTFRGVFARYGVTPQDPNGEEKD